MRPESRQFHRAPFTGNVKFFQWDKAQPAEGVEISVSGMFLKTRAALAEGSMVTLRLSLPSLKHAFTVLGQVVRTVRGGLLAEPGLGIRFLDLRPADRHVIEAYVARRTLEAA